MSDSFRVDPGTFRTALGKSSQFEPKLRAALRKRIKTAGDDAAAAVRAAAMQPGRTQSDHPTSRGLRAGIASSVRVTLSTAQRGAGVRIVASAPLAQAWEAQNGWRHPVFGKRAWVRQEGHPYFRKTITGRRDEIKSQVEAALREALESLGGN